MRGRVITVLVGTDHHPFTRAVQWADAHVLAHPQDTVTVQHGATPGPRFASGVEFMAQPDMFTLMDKSDVVITHGGPGTITSARSCGHRPIVLPRDPARGEHVDNHQLLFGDWSASKGLVRVVTDLGQLDRLLLSLGENGTREDLKAEQFDNGAASRLETLLHSYDAGRRTVAADATRVVLLGGSAGSEAPVLERTLAARSEVAFLGRVARLWEGGIQGGEAPCSCGQPSSRCPFWAEVGCRAFDGWAKVDTGHVRSLMRAVERPGRRAQTMRRHPGAELRRLLVEYSDYCRRIYEAANEVAGTQVVVDASRGAATTLALSHNRHIDLHVVHVVATGAARDLSASWVSSNVALNGLSYRGIPVQRVRDRDMLDDPDRSVLKAWSALRLPVTGALPTVFEQRRSAGTPEHALLPQQARGAALARARASR